MNEIFNRLCLIGVVQALFLFIVLLAKKNNRKANRFPAVIMLFASIDLLEVFLTENGYYDTLAVYPLSVIPYPLIFGPCIFCYSIYAISKISKIGWREVILFIPSAAVLLINLFLFFYSVRPGALWQFSRDQMSSINIKIVTASSVYESVMYILSFYYISRYVFRLKEFFSDIRRLQMLWLRIAVTVLFVLELAVTILYGMKNGMKYETGIADVLVMFFSIILFFAIAFLAMIQPEIFVKIRTMNSSLPDDFSDIPKYEKLRLAPEKEQLYIAKLVSLMQNEKPYLKEDITLQNLAESLSIGTHQLSMILNLHLHKNFYTFINSYRVEDAKTKLSAPENRDANILSIAYSSGFNSKSTFNTMFKKFTGVTPSEYRLSLNNIRK